MKNIAPQSFKCKLRSIIVREPDGSYRAIYAENAKEDFQRLFRVAKMAFGVVHDTSETDVYDVDLCKSLDLLKLYKKETYDKDSEEFIKRSTKLVDEWMENQMKEASIDIPMLTLDEQDGTMVTCAIEYIESPALIYVHLLDEKYKGKYEHKYMDSPY